MRSAVTRLSLLALAVIAAIGWDGIRIAFAQPAQPAARVEPGIALTCEQFCSDTKLRTSNARLRWTLTRAALAASNMENLAAASQTLEVTVYKNGFDKGLMVALPLSPATPDRPVLAVAAPQARHRSIHSRFARFRFASSKSSRSGRDRRHRGPNGRRRRKPRARRQLHVADSHQHPRWPDRLARQPRARRMCARPISFYSRSASQTTGAVMRAAASLLTLACCLAASTASAQLSVVVRDISPDQSNNSDADAASGRPCERPRRRSHTPARVYAASEFGGIWRSTNNGQNWQHLDGHVPTVTLGRRGGSDELQQGLRHVFFDGRANSRSGINVSSDGGVTWTHPASATPPVNFCLTAQRRSEPAAFGIAIDPANASRVFIGTSCGLAISTNAGATWTYVDPTPGDPARRRRRRRRARRRHHRFLRRRRHMRSTDGGTTWTTATTNPLPRRTLFDCGVARRGVRPVCGGRHHRPRDRQRRSVVAGQLRQSRAAATGPHPVRRHESARRRDFRSPGSAMSGCGEGPARRPHRPRKVAHAAATPRPLGRSFSRPTAARRRRRHRLRCGRQRRLSAVLFVGRRRLPQHARGKSRLPHAGVGAADRHAACALELHLLRVQPTRRGDRTPVFRQPGHRHVRRHQWRRHAGHLEQRALLRRVRLRRRRHARADDDVLLQHGGRATRLFVSGPGCRAPRLKSARIRRATCDSFEHLEAILRFAANSYVISTHHRRVPDDQHRRVADRLDATRCGDDASHRLRSAGRDHRGTPTFFTKSGGCDGDRQGTVWRYQGTAGTGTWQQVPNPGVGRSACSPSIPVRPATADRVALSAERPDRAW